MDPKFQTSFIPKKPIAQTIGINVAKPKSGRAVSIYMALAVLLFLASLAGVGGAYAWVQYQKGASETYKKDLAAREKQFNLNSISELKSIDTQISMAKQLLNNHIASSLVFDLIGRLTIEKVRFSTLDFSTPSTGNDGIKVSLTGYGTSLQAVAFQSNVLGSLERYNLRNIVKNPILSNPSLDQKGMVAFGFTATINPNSLSYEQSISDDTSGTSASSASASSTESSSE